MIEAGSCRVAHVFSTGGLAYHILNRRVGRLALFDKPADYSAFEKILNEGGSRGRGKVTRNGMSVLLNNSFYMGVIRLRRTMETFQGIHKPIISKSLFDRVQRVLTKKPTSKGWRHEFLFRRLLTCKYCRSTLIGETQKGYTYYRCHTRGCPTTCVREE